MENQETMRKKQEFVAERVKSRIDGMVVHSAQDLESCLARCGFSNITTHRRNKENICVIAQKIQ